MQKQKNIWLYDDQELPSEVVTDLCKKLNVDEVIARLLVRRGVTNFDEAKNFFRPQLSDLHDPFLMKDMHIAVERVLEAVRENQNILIYGDYDVDGTTAVAMMYHFLLGYTQNISFYIPDRYEEGYGVSMQAIEYATDNDFKLIITLDCGIKAVDKIAVAKQNNIDVIICDHHLPPEVLPEAVAILNPKQKFCDYPFKELSGAGVGFKLICALEQTIESKIYKAYNYLDLLAVSIGADIVPINEENRALAYFGLKKINTNPSYGLAALMKISGRREFGMMDVVFALAPRINAAGRMDKAEKVVEMLISKNEELVKDICSQLEKNNTERKTIERDMMNQCIGVWETDLKGKFEHSNVLYSENWHKGIVGILASKFQEYKYLPTIVLTKSKGKITGSARSVNGFKIVEALDACKQHLEQYGGHQHAAGMTLKEGALDDFRMDFNTFVKANISEDQMRPKIKIDDDIELARIDDKFLRILKQFEPFGPCNEQPVFASKKVIDTGSCRKVGDDHLKLKLANETSFDKNIDAIAFGKADFESRIAGGQPFNTCFHLSENEWMGRKSIQLMIKDIQFTEQ